MANYIDDAGSYNYDATIIGTYTTDATNHTLTMGTDGEADTGYTLPSSSSWLLVETYDIDSTAGDLGGTWFQTDVTDVDTDLAAYRAINTGLVTATTYTSFKMKATLFDGTDAKVYECDNTTPFPLEASPTYTKTSWTPPTGTWKITDTLIAPTDVIRPIYISLNNSTIVSTPPTGITFNEITGYTDTTTTHTLVDIDNASSDITIKLNDSMSNGYAGTTTGDDSGCVSDYELEDAWRLFGSHADFSIYLPEGNYEITISSSSVDNGDNTDYTTEFTMKTIMKSIDSTSDSSTHCATWSGTDKIVSTGETITLDLDRPTGGYWLRINSIRITQVA